MRNNLLFKKSPHLEGVVTLRGKYYYSKLGSNISQDSATKL